MEGRGVGPFVRKIPPLIKQAEHLYRSLSSGCQREAASQETKFDLAKEKRRMAEEKRKAKHTP